MSFATRAASTREIHIEVWLLRAYGDHLHIDAGGGHHAEPPLEISTAPVTPAVARYDGTRQGASKAIEQIQLLDGKVMGVNVDSHNRHAPWELFFLLLVSGHPLFLLNPLRSAARPIPRQVHLSGRIGAR
jgi:hypothetical protein